MATRNVNLTDALDRFVETQVASGSFQNASEVVRAGLRLLKEAEETRAARLAALNAAIQAGIDSGPGIQVDDIDTWLDDIGAEVEAEIATEDAAARAAAE